MRVHSLTREDLEEWGEAFKIEILGALTNENKIEASVADEWCASHTVILKKKGIFRTISDLFYNSEYDDKVYKLLVVKKV